MAALDGRNPRAGHGIFALGLQNVCLAAETAAAVAVHINLEYVMVVEEDDAGAVAQCAAPRPAEQVPPPHNVQHGDIRGDLSGDDVPPADRLLDLVVREEQHVRILPQYLPHCRLQR